MWERGEMKKAELSVFDISSMIINRVEKMPESMDYFCVGMIIATILALIPAAYNLSNSVVESISTSDIHLSVAEFYGLIFEKCSGPLAAVIDVAFGKTLW